MGRREVKRAQASATEISGSAVGRRINLHALAIEEGAMDRDAPSATDPLFVAMNHAFKHGPLVAPKCTLAPCRLGGICWALFERALYSLELNGQVGSAARATRASELCGEAGLAAIDHIARTRGCAQRRADLLTRNNAAVARFSSVDDHEGGSSWPELRIASLRAS